MWEQIKKIKSFIESILDTELNFYAASLSFYTIFALVPLLLVVLSIIATLPNFHNLYLEMKQLILSNLIPTNEEVVSSYLDTFLQNSSKLGELGFISILIT
ncbi:MAG: YihY/virulence factor BrkB family protein, partial [Helicobacter sp.]|nr:YihY/virulence factor BrkB family protein [Helicobacter sp.]